jgi:hypothetical protein
MKLRFSGIFGVENGDCTLVLVSHAGARREYEKLKSEGLIEESHAVQ